MTAPRKRDSGVPTLADVAALAEVSPATVSRVLGGGSTAVRPHLAERVRAAAEQLNYVPNRAARALASSRSDTIGLIVHDVSDPYFGEIARGVLATAAERGHLVVICNTYRDPATEARYVAELRAQRVGAILLAGSAVSPADPAADLLRNELETTIAGGTTVVAMTPYGVGRGVYPDNIGGGALAAELLLADGHRDVVIAAGPAKLVTITNRLRGFLDVWAAADAPAPTVIHETFDRVGGSAVVAAVAEWGEPGPTAVFALNDLMALGAVRELFARGYEPGVDVAVVGFDDIPLAADVRPGLTTIRVPMTDIGTRAIEVLSEVPDPDAAPEIFPCDIVLRDTTFPLR